MKRAQPWPVRRYRVPRARTIPFRDDQSRTPPGPQGRPASPSPLAYFLPAIDLPESSIRRMPGRIIKSWGFWRQYQASTILCRVPRSARTTPKGPCMCPRSRMYCPERAMSWQTARMAYMTQYNPCLPEGMSPKTHQENGAPLGSSGPSGTRTLDQRLMRASL
jgi:hypothetical protein